MHPYSVLDVSLNASLADIKAAYRRLVKESHPDVGGDPEVFHEIQTAYELLSDPERRAQYDLDGIVEDKPADQGRRAALKIIDDMLSGLINEVVSSDNEPVYNGDAMQMMRSIVAAHIKERAQARDKLATGVVRLSKLAERFSVVEGKDNLLAKMVDSRLSNMHRTIEDAEKDIALHNEVTEILADFTFKWDAQQAPQNVYYQQSPLANMSFPFAQARR